jgi:phosphomannomutase
MAGRYFGTDGIRGRANGQITPELALKVGMAAGLCSSAAITAIASCIGKDTRLSGYMIEIRAGRGLHLGRHGRVPARPDADAGGRHADRRCAPTSAS